MTRHERSALARALTLVWNAALTQAQEDSDLPGADLVEALRLLVGLTPGGAEALRVLAARAGAVGTDLYHRTRRVEAPNESARQRRLPLDATR